MPQGRPHIIGIFWHDLGDWLGCYGRPDVDSPALDALAGPGRTARAALLARILVLSAARFHHDGPPSSVARHPRPHPPRLALPARRTGLARTVGPGRLPHCLDRDAGRAKRPVRSDLRGGGHRLRRRARCAPRVIAADEVAARSWRGCLPHRDDEKPFFLTLGFGDVHRPFGTEFDDEVAEMLEVPAFLPDVPPVRADLAPSTSTFVVQTPRWLRFSTRWKTSG